MLVFIPAAKAEYKIAKNIGMNQIDIEITFPTINYSHIVQGAKYFDIAANPAVEHELVTKPNLPMRLEMELRIPREFVVANMKTHNDETSNFIHLFIPKMELISTVVI